MIYGAIYFFSAFEEDNTIQSHVRDWCGMSSIRLPYLAWKVNYNIWSVEQNAGLFPRPFCQCCVV